MIRSHSCSVMSAAAFVSCSAPALLKATSRRRLHPSSLVWPRWGLSGSRVEQDLDRSPLVHGPVAFGGLLQREGQVEDLAGVDLSVPDQVDQFGQEAAHRCGPAVQVHVGEEQLLAGQLDPVGDADVAAGVPSRVIDELMGHAGGRRAGALAAARWAGLPGDDPQRCSLASRPRWTTGSVARWEQLGIRSAAPTDRKSLAG
jgi:hypothetical protein